MACVHLEFNALVEVHRLKRDPASEEIAGYAADIRISCRECGQPLEFYGLPMGCSPYQPSVSIDGQQLRAPLVIPGTKPPDGLPGFSIEIRQNRSGTKH